MRVWVGATLETPFSRFIRHWELPESIAELQKGEDVGITRIATKFNKLKFRPEVPLLFNHAGISATQGVPMDLELSALDYEIRSVSTVPAEVPELESSGFLSLIVRQPSGIQEKRPAPEAIEIVASARDQDRIQNWHSITRLGSFDFKFFEHSLDYVLVPAR